MPRSSSNRPCRFALASQFDARPWSNTNVFDRGATSVTLPSYGTGEGVFLDVLDFLNGFGSEDGEDLNSDLDSGWQGEGGGAGELTIALNSDDFVEITSTAGGTFTILPDADNAWFGFPTAGSGPHAAGTITAPNPWKRGLLTNGLSSDSPSMRIERDATGGIFNLPENWGWIQDLRVAFRVRGSENDVDDTANSNSLEAVDVAANGTAIRWGVTDDGYVYTTYPLGESAPDWTSDSFRDRLGFTGDETSVEIAGVGRYLLASKPCPGLIIPSRPLSVQTPFVERAGSEIRLTDGSFASISVGEYNGYEIEFVIDGPQDSTDLHREYLRLRSEFARLGEPITLYQDWGDSRRSLLAYQITSIQPAYDNLHTSQENGYYGRVLCRVDPASPRAEAPFDGPFRRRARASLTLSFREDGV